MQGENLVTVSAFGRGRPAPARQLAALHRELLPTSPAVRLGDDFLERFYYGVLPEEGLMIGTVVYVDDQLAGFVAATPDANGFLATAVRRRWATLASILVRHPPSPRGAWAAARIALDRGHHRATDVAELLSLGVRAPEHGGPVSASVRRRVTRELLRSALAALEGRTVVALVDESNTLVRLMYSGMGWTVTGRVTAGWPVPQLVYQSPDEPAEQQADSAIRRERIPNETPGDAARRTALG
jgi:hypothetical protein